MTLKSYPYEEVRRLVPTDQVVEKEASHLGPVIRNSIRLMVCSPLPGDDDSTPSFAVDLRTQKWCRYGHGLHGDIFDYWELTRGVSPEQARKELLAEAGLDQRDVGSRKGRTPRWKPMAKQPVRSGKAEEKKNLSALSGRDLKRYQEGVDWLTDPAHPERVAKLAAWRGYRVETVLRAAALGKISMPRMGRWLQEQDADFAAGRCDRRVAFAVECPSVTLDPVKVKSSGAGSAPATGSSVTLAYHQRIKQAGKKGKFTSWRFIPSGVGAWPFVLGEPAKAATTIVCEGQWDALAAMELLAGPTGWDDLASGALAVVGVRGAGSIQFLVDGYWRAVACPARVSKCLGQRDFWSGMTRRQRTRTRSRRPEAVWPERTCLLVPDADEAGAKWLSAAQKPKDKAQSSKPVAGARTAQAGCNVTLQEWAEFFFGTVGVIDIRTLLPEGASGKDLNDVLLAHQHKEQEVAR